MIIAYSRLSRNRRLLPKRHTFLCFSITLHLTFRLFVSVKLSLFGHPFPFWLFSCNILVCGSGCRCRGQVQFKAISLLKQKPDPLWAFSRVNYVSSASFAEHLSLLWARAEPQPRDGDDAAAWWLPGSKDIWRSSLLARACRLYYHCCALLPLSLLPLFFRTDIRATTQWGMGRVWNSGSISSVSSLEWRGNNTSCMQNDVCM